MSTLAKAYIILVNYNGWKDTVNCIQSLLCLHYPNFQIVVVDNCSSDGSVRRIRKRLKAIDISTQLILGASQEGCSSSSSLSTVQEGKGPPPASQESTGTGQVVIISSSENLGFAGGNNAGIRYGLSRGDASFFWILNNDTVAHRDALGALIDTIERPVDRSEPIAMCGSVILDFHVRTRIQAYGGATVNRFLGTTRNLMAGESMPKSGELVTEAVPDYISGCSLLVKSECLQIIGLFDEYFFLYWEDTEWCFRCRRSGFRLTVASESLVWHRKGSTTKRFPISGFYNARNSLLFIHDYYPRYFVVCLALKPIIFLAIFLRNRDYPFFRESLRGYMKILKAGLGQRDFGSAT